MPTAPRRRAPRRRYTRPLSRQKIAEAAIDIVRSDGHAALSMRKVAGLFDVDVAALYRHFRNKDELLAEVGRLAAEVAELEAPTEGSLEERFLELASRIRDRIVRHPELGLYGGGSPWATPFIARANGLIAALFHEAGLAGPELVYATQSMLHLVTSIAQSEVMTRATSPEANREFAETILQQLPEPVREDWPSTRARHDWTVDFDAFFAFAVRATLDAMAQARGRSR